MKALCASSLTMLLVSGVLAQPPDSLWSRTFGGSGHETCSAVRQTADGGYVLAGTTGSFGAGDYDFWLVKTDSNGDCLWSRTFGGNGAEGCNAMDLTTDGGYVLAGYTFSFGAGRADFWVVKTNANGDSVWSRTFGGSFSDECWSVRQTADGGYALAGTTGSFGSGIGDFWLVKMNAGGDYVWDRTFGGLSSEVCTQVLQVPDGGYVLAGDTYSFGAGGADFWMVKTDVNGDSLWSRTFGGSFDDLCWSAEQTTDGGYILAGSTRSVGAGRADFWLVKTNVDGDSLWSLACGGNFEDECRSALQTTDGGYAVAGITGFSWDYPLPAGDVWLVKASAQGDSVWSRRFGRYDRSEGCNSCIQTADGGFVLAGNTAPAPYGRPDFWLVKTGPELDVEDDFILHPSSFSLSAYPNPFNAATTLEFAVPKASQVTISAYDILGRDAGTIARDFFTPGFHRVHWVCAECPSGVYFMVMSGEDFHLTQKAILLR